MLESTVRFQEKVATPMAKESALTSEEKAALQETVRERHSQSKKSDDPQALLAEVLAKISEMPEPDRSVATRVHELVLGASDKLTARTWYGMPAYYLDGKNICFFQNPAKFKVRYATLGFSDSAKLDDGEMWPTSYAITELTPKVEAQITELVKRAVG